MVTQASDIPLAGRARGPPAPRCHDPSAFRTRCRSGSPSRSRIERSSSSSAPIELDLDALAERARAIWRAVRGTVLDRREASGVVRNSMTRRCSSATTARSTRSKPARQTGGHSDWELTSAAGPAAGSSSGITSPTAPKNRSRVSVSHTHRGGQSRASQPWGLPAPASRVFF